jgi:acyl-CoA synthetase (AMP-forming)/AMP-acid ligase II
VIILAQSPEVDKYDISSLRGAISAAAPLGSDLIDAVQKRLPKLTITQAYGKLYHLAHLRYDSMMGVTYLGLTETSPISHCMTTTEALLKPGSIGRLLPTFEARLISEGRDVGKGERGELWMRGPSVMKGYLRNEIATRNTFDGEGKGRWFMTGDVAIVDDDGYFT